MVKGCETYDFTSEFAGVLRRSDVGVRLVDCGKTGVGLGAHVESGAVGGELWLWVPGWRRVQSGVKEWFRDVLGQC